MWSGEQGDVDLGEKRGARCANMVDVGKSQWLSIIKVGFLSLPG
jgi:hypothetical protein